MAYNKENIITNEGACCPTIGQTVTKHQKIRQMHTALHFQQEGQIIVQICNTRCLCSPSGIIIQVRPEKSIKINSNKKNALLRPPETQSEQIPERKLCQNRIYFETKVKV